MEAARHFELYHSSRESFLYLKHFYIGEVRAEDRASIPQPSPEPSVDFIQQLREYTTFRLVPAQVRDGVGAAAPASHLGAARAPGVA